MKTISGRSLIELLVILSIIVLLSSYAVTRFAEHIKKAHAQHALEKTQSSISLARQTAFNQKTKISFCGVNTKTNPSNNLLECRNNNITSWVIFEDNNDDFVVDSQKELIRLVEIVEQSASFSLKASFNRKGIRFSAIGGALESASLIYCPKTAQQVNTQFLRILTINLSGRSYEVGDGALGEKKLSSKEISSALPFC